MCRPDDYPPHEDVPSYRALTKLRERAGERDLYITATQRMRERVIDLDLYTRLDPYAVGYKKALMDFSMVLREVMDETTPPPQPGS